MSEFVGDGEGCTDPVVLYDGATSAGVTHSPRLRQAKCVTFVSGPANVLSCNENSCVVMIWVSVILGVGNILPGAKVFEGLKRV